MTKIALDIEKIVEWKKDSLRKQWLVRPGILNPQLHDAVENCDSYKCFCNWAIQYETFREGRFVKVAIRYQIKEHY